MAFPRRIRPRTRPIPGQMNKTEAAYDAVLLGEKMAGKVIDYRFQPIKLRLAEKTFYTPDFMVVTADQIELHEVKGFWEDDARVKIKVAAAMFPEFLFIAVRKIKGGWDREEF